jgi:hypothetical protein
MRAFGFISRALVVEAVAVGAIIWVAAGGAMFEDASRGESATIKVAQSSGETDDRSSFVQSKLERVASQLRSGANQLVDEALATWFGK